MQTYLIVYVDVEEEKQRRDKHFFAMCRLLVKSVALHTALYVSCYRCYDCCDETLTRLVTSGDY